MVTVTNQLVLTWIENKHRLLFLVVFAPPNRIVRSTEAEEHDEHVDLDHCHTQDKQDDGDFVSSLLSVISCVDFCSQVHLFEGLTSDDLSVGVHEEDKCSEDVGDQEGAHTVLVHHVVVR